MPQDNEYLHSYDGREATGGPQPAPPVVERSRIDLSRDSKSPMGAPSNLYSDS